MGNIWTPSSDGRSVQVHKYLPTAADVHVDQMLTDFGVAYQQEESAYLASSIFPFKPVAHQTDKYPIWPKADFYRDEARKRAPGTPTQRGGYRLSSDSYYCDVYEFGTKIPIEVRRNADNWANLDQVATRYVNQILAIRRERDFVTNFLTTGIWATDMTGTASTVSSTQFVQWDASSGSVPINDFLKGHRAIQLATGKKANTAILGYDVWLALLTNAQITARLINGQTPNKAADVSDEDLARLLRVDRLIVARAVYNSDPEGDSTPTMAFIAGKVAWLGYVDPSPGIESLTAGATFTWSGMPGGSAMGTVIENRWDPNVKSDLIDGYANWSMKVTASDAGYFFTAAVS